MSRVHCVVSKVVVLDEVFTSIVITMDDTSRHRGAPHPLKLQTPLIRSAPLTKEMLTRGLQHHHRTTIRRTPQEDPLLQGQCAMQLPQPHGYVFISEWTLGLLGKLVVLKKLSLASKRSHPFLYFVSMKKSVGEHYVCTNQVIESYYYFFVREIKLIQIN